MAGTGEKCLCTLFSVKNILKTVVNRTEKLCLSVAYILDYCIKTLLAGDIFSSCIPSLF